MQGRLVFLSDLGWMGVAFSDQGLVRLAFDHASERAATRALDGCSAERTDDHPQRVQLQQRLSDYTEGAPTSLDDLAIDWSGLTPFQVRVLKACRRIPWGQTRSYGDLAKAVGAPRAARAVGSVMARNRVPLIIPCHRVVGSGGALGGFSSRTGLSMKRRLLTLEGASAVHRSDQRVRHRV